MLLPVAKLVSRNKVTDVQVVTANQRLTHSRNARVGMVQSHSYRKALSFGEDTNQLISIINPFSAAKRCIVLAALLIRLLVL